MKPLAPFGFLTRFVPVDATLEDVGRAAFLFPLVGALIGILVGTVGWLLGAVLSPILAGALTVVSLYAATGILHLDGLADFADGLAARGDSVARWEVMRRAGVGAAGVLASFLILLTTWATVAEILSLSDESPSSPLGLPLPVVIIGASEVAAKLAMNFAMALGRPLSSGMAASVIGASQRSQLWVATAIAVAAISLLAGWAAAPLGLLPWLPTAALVFLAHRRIGGMSGDVLGSVNEVARTTNLLAWAVILRIS